MLFALYFLGLTQVFGKSAMFHASQSNNLVQVRTPYGTSLYIGDIGFDRLSHYTFEIPLSDLRGMSGHSSSSGESMGSADKDVSSYIVHANQLYNQGKYPAALRYVNEVLRRDPMHSRGWTMKGSLLHVMGEKAMAKEAWEKALSFDPTNEQVRNLLKE